MRDAVLEIVRAKRVSTILERQLLINRGDWRGPQARPRQSYQLEISQCILRGLAITRPFQAACVLSVRRWRRVRAFFLMGLPN